MNQTSHPKIGIVVLNINQYDHTVNCFRSLQQLTYPNWEAVLVDNGSDPECLDQIRAELPELTILCNPVNLGFSEGNNIGIRHLVHQRDCEHILLLNNDTDHDPDFLTHLVNRLEQDAALGAVAPKIYFHSDRDRVWDFGGIYDETTGNVSAIGYKQEDRGQFERSEPDYLCACSLLLRGRALREVGLLDPALFYYCEDLDWCLRARHRRFTLATVAEAKVWHKVSQTIETEWIAYIWVRNRAAVRYKNRPANFHRFVRRFAREILRDSKWDLKQGNPLAATTRWMGLVDFCLGRFGKGRIAVGRESTQSRTPLPSMAVVRWVPTPCLVGALYLMFVISCRLSPHWSELKHGGDGALEERQMPAILRRLIPTDGP